MDKYYTYGCKNFEMCKNYSHNNCSICIRCTGNGDCFDFYDDSDLYFDSDQDDIDDLYLSDFHLDPFGIDPIF